MPVTRPPQRFQPHAGDYQTRVKASFKQQRAMKTLGISLVRVAAGEVELRLPFQPGLTQQHGFIHAGVISTALDSACGYSAFSLMPADAAVLTVEFKINLLSPAKGDYFTFVGTVVKPGKSITVSQGEAWVHIGDGNSGDGERKLIAQMTATLMTIVGRDGIRG